MNRTTPAQRRAFYRHHLQGATYQDIADYADVSRECVRYWCRRQRDGGGCQSRYHRSAPGLLSQFAPVVRYVILRLKLEHPRWGRERIHHYLQRRRSCRGHRLPHPSSIGRYLHQWSRFRRRRARKRQPRLRPETPTKVHQRWQLDFKVDIEQAQGQKLALHTLVDQYSGTCIEAKLLAKETVVRQAARVTWREAQNTLRCGFSTWGTRPESVQTDGEPSLIGRPRWDFPTDFSLWLTGLGISHSVIRSGRCTDNAEVERGHRTVHDYAIVGQEHQAVADLQVTVRQAARELAFSLPSRAKSCNGRPPATAYPELLRTARPYQLGQEMALFDMDSVDTYLASFQWRRKVNVNGVVQLGGKSRKYSIGRRFGKRDVLIRFDVADRHLVFLNADDPQQELCRRPIRGLSAYNLIGLDDPNVALVPQQLPLLPKVLKG